MRNIHFGIIAITLSACGVQGKNGMAKYDVGNTWETEQSIALGSVFDVNVNGGLFSAPLVAVSSNEDVFTQLQNNRFQASSEGSASFLAMNPSGEIIDEIVFMVSGTDTVGLSSTSDVRFDPDHEIFPIFALVQGETLSLKANLWDEFGYKMHHNNVVETEVDGFNIGNGYGDNVSIYGKHLGYGEFTVTAGAAQEIYDVNVVEQSDIEFLGIRVSEKQNSIFSAEQFGSSSPDSNGLYWYKLQGLAMEENGLEMHGADIELSMISGSNRVQMIGEVTQAWIGIPDGETAIVSALCEGLESSLVIGD